MDGEDEEFEKLLGEIPQAMDSPAQLEGLERTAEHALPQLEGKDVPRTQSTESFQGFLQAFQPLLDLEGCTEERMYFPLSAGNAKRREDRPGRSTTREERGRRALDLSANVNPLGALDPSYSFQHEEDPYRFVSNQSNLIDFKTPEDASLATAFASLELQEGSPVQYKSKQAEKMGHAEFLGHDMRDLLGEPAALHDQAEAALGNNIISSTNFTNEVSSTWLTDVGSFQPTTSSFSSAQLATNTPVSHSLRQDFKTFVNNKSSKRVFFANAESPVSDVPDSHMYGPAYANYRDMEPGGTLLSYCNGGKNFNNFRGFGSQAMRQQPEKVEGPVGSWGQVDGAANYYSTGNCNNGMASYLQAQQLHKIQVLQQVREEERKHRIEQILMHPQPAGCSQDCVDARNNNIFPSFYVDKDHGYGFPKVGGTFGLDLRHHLRQQLIDPHADNFCTGKDCSHLHSKPRGAARNKDFLVSPAHFGNVLHKSTSLTLHDEKPPVRILSRKSSRVAAPSSSPLMGCVFNTNNRCIHSESQGCFHPSATLWNAPLELENLKRPSLEPLKAFPDGMHPGSVYSSLAEIEGRIFSVAKDQHGCRFLQRKFDEGAIEDVQKIFSEIIDHAVELMVDPFGNYLIQKLLEVCTDDQRTELLKSMTKKGELISVSLNTHGTRAVQKLVETLNSSQQVSIVTASLRSGVVTLIKDLNGNHVIQRCLQHLSNNDNEFIFEAAAYNCVEIATHRHGCCVLQRCIDHSTGVSRQRLIHEIALNSLQLSQDSFGNYVVQYVLDLGLSWAREEVMDHLVENYARLSMQKFSSNVVEKCLQLSGEEGRVRIVQELIDSSHLLQLLQDPYANYVIQSALMVSKGALHTSVVEAIRPHIPSLRSSPYGKRILSRRSFKKF